MQEDHIQGEDVCVILLDSPLVRLSALSLLLYTVRHAAARRFGVSEACLTSQCSQPLEEARLPEARKETAYGPEPREYPPLRACAAYVGFHSGRRCRDSCRWVSLDLAEAGPQVETLGKDARPGADCGGGL